MSIQMNTPNYRDDPLARLENHELSAVTEVDPVMWTTGSGFLGQPRK